jgi:glycosyltransferase
MDATTLTKQYMNLYIFNEARRGAKYGVGTYIHELTVALKSSNINICIVNLISDKPQIQTEEIDGIKHWHFPLALPDQRTTGDQEQWEQYLRNVVYLLRLHIKDKRDLIFHLNYYQRGKLIEELKNTFECSVVVTAHFSEWGFGIFDNLPRLRNILNEKYPDSFGRKLQKAFEEEKLYYSKADRIICLSNYMQKILCKEYAIDATKISVIPNGLVDLHDFTAQSKLLRNKWHIQEKEKIILFAGRIDEVKGLSYLIKAFREVLKKLPKCRLIIAGSGSYDTYMKESQDICTKITFTGLLEKKDLYEIYQTVDVGVVPSLFEPFGLVAVEMMMHKLPIVVTATSGLDEVVDETSGLKVPITVLPENVEVDALLLAQKIVYLLLNPAEAKRLGQNGRKRYLENYSSKVFRNNMLQIYNSLCRSRGDDKIKTLIVTGQSNHKWEISHIAIKRILENSGLFTVDTIISPKAGEYMFNFKPDFASYQLIVLDYNGDRWPEETEKSFINFIEKGGGVIVCHSANNAFRHWKAYNQIIGLGGWEGRDETDGPYVYMKDGRLVYDKESIGLGGSHGSRHEFVLNCGNPNHPITNGLPAAWLHAQDELYDRMRGPGMVNDVLFWAYSNPETKGSGRDEIAIFTVDYGNARIFHTTLGHVGNTLDDNIAMQCTGFQVTLLRGAEWAATGEVTQQVPNDFPTATTISLRKNYR